MNWKKKVEVLGLEIPVLAIIAVLAVPLIAGATLSYFGEISGESTVEQAIVIEDENAGEASLTYTSFDGDATGGDTVVDGPYEVQNNMDEDYDLTFESMLDVGGTTAEEVVDLSIAWGEEEEDLEGLQTEYVDAFADAGADIPAYSTEVTESEADVVVGSGDKIQGTLESIGSDGDPVEDPVILVKSGYDSSDETVGEFTHPDSEGPEEYLIRAKPGLPEQDWTGELTIVSEAGPENTVIDANNANYGIVIGGDSTVATVKGFNIKNYQNVGVLAGSWHNVDDKDNPTEYVNPERVDILHNYFGRGPSDKFSYGVELAYSTTGTVKYNELEMQGLDGKKEVGAILVAETSDVVISNNIITNGQDSDELGIAVANFGGMFSGVKTPLKNLTIKHNTITGGKQGIGIEAYKGAELRDIVVKHNSITGSKTGMDIKEKWPNYTDVSNGDIAGTVVNYNVIDSDTTDIDYQVDGETLDANNNWWGSDGISIEGEEVEASYKVLEDPTTVPAEDTLEFGAVNEFDTMVTGEETYDLTTKIS